MISWDVKLRPYADHLEINLIVRNTSDQPIQLEFPTSKFYDFSIMDDKKEVYRFSKGRYFLQAFQYINLGSGEEKKWTMNWDYKNKGERVAAGNYTLIATLLPSKIDNMQGKNQLVAKQAFTIPAIHDIQIEGSTGNYTITGIVEQPLNERFYYTVDDGHRLIVAKRIMPISKDSNSFELSLQLPLEIMSQNESLIFSIYTEKDEPAFIERLKK
ncbi:BsuPI-related putative proteinase inhibitor [Bacillus sp. FJAT-49736]|uniref:BsuPI-related putative proteinase inhibitor n=1 Tax=Bacillus sp. FJAT-49736 TaxID=2833582 RepID=UPI001BC9C570|nr:hypothetical protein [Bacillus sp. FJAT-49736]